MEATSISEALLPKNDPGQKVGSKTHLEKKDSQKYYNSSSFFQLLAITYNEARRHKVIYWMSFLCCFLSVFAMIIVNSVVNYMPFVFLLEAEKISGDIDFIVRSTNASNLYLDYSMMNDRLSNSKTYTSEKEREYLPFLSSSPRQSYTVNVFQYNDPTHCHSEVVNSDYCSERVQSVMRDESVVSERVGDESVVSERVSDAFKHTARENVSGLEQNDVCTTRKCDTNGVEAQLYLIDFEKETAIGWGRSFTYSFNQSPTTHQVTQPPTQSLNHSLTHSLTRSSGSVTQSEKSSVTHSLIDSLNSLSSSATPSTTVTHSLSHSLSRSSTQSSTQSTTPSLTHSPHTHAVISKEIAKVYSLKEGDRVTVSVRLDEDLIRVLEPSACVSDPTGECNPQNRDNERVSEWRNTIRNEPFSVIDLPVTIVDNAWNKVSYKLTNFIFVDSQNSNDFLKLILNGIRKTKTDFPTKSGTGGEVPKPFLPNANSSVEFLNHYAHYVGVNLNSEEKLKLYSDSSFDRVKKRVSVFLETINYRLGFPVVETVPPLLNELESRANINMYLSLISDLILLLLLCLSVNLLLNLTNISIYYRKNDLQVFLMIGSTRNTIIFLLLLQILMFSVVGTVLGLIVASVICGSFIYYLNSHLFLNLKFSVSVHSLILSLLLGIVTPVVTAAFPIMKVLRMGERVSETNRIHSVIQVQQQSFTHSPSHSFIHSLMSSFIHSVTQSPLIVIGALLVSVAGYLVYYYLPLGFISGNMTIILYVFMFLFALFTIGLLIALLIFIFPISRLILFFSSFFSNMGVRKYATHSLTNNRRSSLAIQIILLFSYTAIIFVDNTINVQTNLILTNMKFYHLSSIQMYSFNSTIGSSNHLIDRFNSFNTLRELEGGWMSDPLTDYSSERVSERVSGSVSERPILSNRATVVDRYVNVITISENLMAVSFKQWVKGGESPVHCHSCSSDPLRYLKQMYSMDENWMIVPDNFKNVYFSDIEKESFLIRFRGETTTVRPFSSLKRFPLYRFSPPVSLIDSDYPTVIVSPATYVRLSMGLYNTTDDIPVRSVFVRVSDQDHTPLNTERVRESVSELNARLSGVNAVSVADEYDLIYSTVSYLKLGFFVVSIIANVISLFSLISSFTIHILDFRLEISILRAIGFSKKQIMNAFFLESLSLLSSPLLLGLITGTILSFFISYQQSLLMDVPLQLGVNVGTYLVTLLLCLLSEWVCVYFPLKTIFKDNIAKSLKGK